MVLEDYWRNIPTNLGFNQGSLKLEDKVYKLLLVHLDNQLKIQKK